MCPVGVLVLTVMAAVDSGSGGGGAQGSRWGGEKRTGHNGNKTAKTKKKSLNKNRETIRNVK